MIKKEVFTKEVNNVDDKKDMFWYRYVDSRPGSSRERMMYKKLGWAKSKVVERSVVHDAVR
jgi:hypothetical protein